MNFDDLKFDAWILKGLRPDGDTVHPLHDVAKLTEETGEVAECFTKSIKTKEDLGEELSDVLIVVAAIALRENIDLNDVCKKKQKKRIKKLVDRFHEGRMPLDTRLDIVGYRRSDDTSDVDITGYKR
jgi:NTP pyrophosphatase (non-canonical NTP hydrolase)